MASLLFFYGSKDVLKSSLHLLGESLPKKSRRRNSESKILIIDAKLKQTETEKKIIRLITLSDVPVGSII